MRVNKILVIGSSNTDMVVKTQKLPLPGETMLGGTFLMNAGGKGANQAVAAVRMGAQTSVPLWNESDPLWNHKINHIVSL